MGYTRTPAGTPNPRPGTLLLCARERPCGNYIPQNDCAISVRMINNFTQSFPCGNSKTIPAIQVPDPALIHPCVTRVLRGQITPCIPINIGRLFKWRNTYHLNTNLQQWRGILPLMFDRRQLLNNASCAFDATHCRTAHTAHRSMPRQASRKINLPPLHAKIDLSPIKPTIN